MSGSAPTMPDRQSSLRLKSSFDIQRLEMDCLIQQKDRLKRSEIQ
jgi:hypothetical protein